MCGDAMNDEISGREVILEIADSVLRIQWDGRENRPICSGLFERLENRRLT